MPMPDREAFFTAIRSRPEDDEPRLVYADFLEEQGDPRAELIRVQCEAARLPAESPQRRELEYDAEDLIRKHRGEWIPKPLSKPTFKRGFIHTARLSIAQFLRYADKLTSMEPFWQLQLHGAESTFGKLTELIKMPALAKFPAVHMGVAKITFPAPRPLPAKCVKKFLTSPHLANLVELNLPQVDLNQLPSLKRCPNLRSLNLASIARLQDLAPILELADLDSLELSHTDVNNLAGIGQLSKLRKLGLRNTPVKDLEPLAELSHLESLGLDLCEIGDFSPLANFAGVLRELTLTRATVDSLQPVSGAHQLQYLDISETPISSLEPISRAIHMRRLNAWGTAIRDLAPLAGFAKLEVLKLSDTPVSDAKPLQRLGELRELHLGGTDIRDFTPLLKLSKLRTLTLPRRGPAADFRKLKKALPDCEIEVDRSTRNNRWE